MVVIIRFDETASDFSTRWQFLIKPDDGTDTPYGLRPSGEKQGLATSLSAFGLPNPYFCVYFKTKTTLAGHRFDIRSGTQFDFHRA